MPESRDLELVLAIISHLKFTVQFWTASTRLASAMKVPWLLFESPNQIVGNGQEGIRIALTTDEDKKKLVLSNYFNVLENQEERMFLSFGFQGECPKSKALFSGDDTSHPEPPVVIPQVPQVAEPVTVHREEVVHQHVHVTVPVVFKPEPLSQKDKQLVITASVLLLVILLMLWYMYSQGRI
jgi:hypothetical protein